jgi:DNA-binding PadR family transcriptional regulator
MDRNPKPSSLGLIILALLFEEPMHAYRMQKLMKERGKDTVVNVRQRASVYQTLDRLLGLGLIEVRKTVRTMSHPDRIVYAITALGRDVAKQWLKKMLATTIPSFPEFPAALSVLMMLPPIEVQTELESRVLSLRETLRKLRAGRRAAGDLPRLFLLDDDYRIALSSAELAFIQGLIIDLKSGSLRWNEEWIRKVATQFAGTAS